MNDKLDSFNKYKRKCKECKKYFDLDDTPFKLNDTCIECSVKEIVKMFINLKQKNPNITLPPDIFRELTGDKSNE
jgi:hypothetical protein